MRYRDPETGTFLTRDPLGLKAGPNQYTYVRQNPWTHFDPEGLDMAAVTQFWAGMGDSFIAAGKGAAHAVMHPVDTAGAVASGVAHTVAHPIDTATAIKTATLNSLQSGPRGQGQVMGNILMALAPIGSAGAVAKAGSNIASKVGDLVASTKVENTARNVVEAPKVVPKTPVPAPAPASAYHQPGYLPDEAPVVRGGSESGTKSHPGGNSPAGIAGGTDTVPAGKTGAGLTGFSAQSAPGMTAKEIANATVPNKSYGATTAGQIRAAGGDPVPTPRNNGTLQGSSHVTVTGLHPDTASKLLTPTVKKNP